MPKGKRKLPSLYSIGLLKNLVLLFLAVIVIFCWIFRTIIPSHLNSHNYYSPKFGESNSTLPREEHSIKEFKSVINFTNIKIPYRVEVPKAEQCPRGTKLLILTMSRRDAFEIRETIRQSWAKDAVPGTVIRFLLADAGNQTGNKTIIEEMNKKLEREQSEKGDLIIFRGFEDSYAHIHLKWYAGLEWQQQFCARVDWILKADDDTVVHLPRLDYWIEHKFRGELAKNPASYFGNVWYAMHPIRDKDSKWHVPESSFPGPQFPVYLRGPSYLASRQAISAILPHTSKVIGFNMDDVVFTGILADLGNVTRSDQGKHFALTDWGWKGKECEDGVSMTISLFAYHSPESLRGGYKKIVEDKC